MSNLPFGRIWLLIGLLPGATASDRTASRSAP
jgi:hypothetical protein